LLLVGFASSGAVGGWCLVRVVNRWASPAGIGTGDGDFLIPFLPFLDDGMIKRGSGAARQSG